jgi:sarcosine oxidase subunit alpha
VTGFRLTRGGRIDRARPVAFTFDGRPCQGYLGDTLAAALIANDVFRVGRSFKYHRPRGIMAAGAEEPNALVQLEAGASTQPNLRATQVELYDGLAARSLNAWPSLRWDFASATGLLSPLLVAGFYYKTFMWPRALWQRLYEPAIRAMAGLGTAPTEADPDSYDKINAHADVVVVGAGPAGLMAALVASRAGARIMLVDEQAELGGSLLHERQSIDGRPAAEWVAAAIRELAARPEVTILPRTTAFGYYDHNYLILLQRRTDHLGPLARPGMARQRLWHVRAKHVVLATGAHERPLVFPDNDRPGIMLASAVSCYVARYGVAPGRCAAIVTNNDSAYRTALDLADAGVRVAAIIDARPPPQCELASAARRLGIEVISGSTVARVAGHSRLAAIDVRPLGESGRASRGFACDLLAVSGGWSPAVHLFSQSQGKLRWDDARACFVPGRAAQAQHSVGAANGTFDLGGCLREGASAGAAAVGLAEPGLADVPTTEKPVETPTQPFWTGPTRARHPGKAFVDFQNDVTEADIRLAASEGLVSVEHVKRYTTTGMATDQGKTSNVNALAILSQAIGRPIAATGTTSFRPPYTPVTYGALAGRDIGALLDPVRVTPMHAGHVQAGAVFEDVGQWKRPWFYPGSGEAMPAAVAREAKAARTSVGIQDVSTLGKIEVRGPDAAEFLDRVYTNGFGKLAMGRCRYAMMCRDDGMVFDDGVTTRLADDQFFMTTTTGGAARVLDWLEELLQTDWPELKVYLTSVTDHWAAVALAGPRSRDLMRDLAPDMALENDAFPFLAMRTGVVAGLAARVFRISFSGELAYEIHVPAHHGLAAWQAIMAAGRPYDITPYGTEAMHLLRAEKGFIIVGQDTDGTVTPLDLGMDWIVSKQKNFIGKRSLSRIDTGRADRKQLVGLLPEDPAFVLPEGAQLVEATQGERPATPSIGHVTSSYWSPNLGHSFALALVKGGRARLGALVYAPLDSAVVPARVVEPVFWDKKGARQNA